MTKVNATVLKPSNGGTDSAKASAMTVVPGSPKPETPAKDPQPEPVRELTLQEKILKVENLQLLVEKRQRLVQTRGELDRFQTASNDFNCSMRLNDSDGNVFTTNFTPGIKKVIEFLRSSFDASIADVESKIKF